MATRLRNLGRFQKGHRPWNVGTRQPMKPKQADAARARLSVLLAAETREQRAARTTPMRLSPLRLTNLRKARKSAASRAKTAQASRRMHKAMSPWRRAARSAKLSVATTEQMRSPRRKAIAAVNMRNARTFVDPKRRLAAVKAWWVSLPVKERRRRTELARKAATSQTENTSLERAIHAVLRTLGVPFRTQVPFGTYTVDIYVPGRQLVIECDGEYWHALGSKNNRRRRDAYLRKAGVVVLHLPGKEIMSGRAATRVAKAVA